MADRDVLAIHVVSHTHWDREWYHASGRFRQRLVALIDELLDDPPPFGESFLLDGQAIVLDDYFAVQPERRGEVAALLRERRLEAGPWYVLADELIPSGEALVRNLIAGHRALRALGAEPPQVLYCPDSFGHPAALPFLAREFGLPLVIVWRGYGGRRWPAGDTVRWRAPDGGDVLLFHLPPAGYEFGSSLPSNEKDARTRWAAMRDVLARRSTLGLLLVQNGADHHARQRDYRAAIDALEHVAKPAPLVRGSLATFAEALVARATDRELPVAHGELRDSYGYTWALQGTFATRAAQKMRNARAERLLVRDAEPWAAIAANAGALDRAPLVRAAWRALLACHPHDTLCGCSIDSVARAMNARLTDVMVQGRGIRDDALLDVIGHDAADARARRAEWRNVVVVRNAAARARSGVAEIVVATFEADVAVGPGSAARDATVAQVATRAVANAGAGAGKVASRSKAGSRHDVSGSHKLQLLDGDDPVTMQRLDETTDIELTESALHYPDADRVRVTRALAWVRGVPGYGTRSLLALDDVRGRPTSARVYRAGDHAHGAATRVEDANSGATHVDDSHGEDTRPTAHAGDDFIANDALRIEWTDRGAVRLTTADGRRIGRLIALEDQTDHGDLYTPSLRGRVRTAKFIDARILHAGPLRAEVETRWRFAAERPIRVRLSLDAGASWLRVRVAGVNATLDHRLRIVFATGLGANRSSADTTDEIWADAAFGAVLRTPLIVAPDDDAAEQPPPTAPLHRYVSRVAGAHGATLFSDGLAEYEARDDGSIAVTLLRAVGELSRNDLPERPGHAGWPAHVPAAQMLGAYRATFGLLLHGARTTPTIDEIERTADDLLLPLRGRSLRSALTVPAPTLGVQLHGEGLAFSACKPSDDGDWTVLRCVNLTPEERTGEWRLGWTPNEVRASRLDESVLAPLPFDGSRIGFTVIPRATITIVVR